VGVAITMTIAGYKRQLQLALTPSASTGRLGAARGPRAIAWFFVFGNRIARSISTFILTTLARSSPQQVTIAINAALGLTIVVGVVMVLGETIALTVDFVPFTRPYEPGHARLRTRWPIYFVGLFVFALWPARAAMWNAGDPNGVMRIAGVFLAIAFVLELAGRWRARSWSIDPAEEFVEPSEISVLDIGMVVPQTRAS